MEDYPSLFHEELASRREAEEAEKGPKKPVGIEHPAAKDIAGKFREIGGFSSVEVHEIGTTADGDGIGTGRYEVHLWNISAQAGNRNLTVVSDMATDAEIKRIAKTAKASAKNRDSAAIRRAEAERED